MEGGKYNLGKAQEEAEKLQQKVKSGDASSYGEAEKLVEQETKKKEAIASQVGLKMDSMLVGVLSSLDKEQRDNIIATLSDQAQFFKNKHGDYSSETLAKIFSSLNNEAIATRIKTPEDFRRYADKVMEMAKLHLHIDADGKPSEL